MIHVVYFLLLAYGVISLYNVLMSTQMLSSGFIGYIGVFSLLSLELISIVLICINLKKILNDSLNLIILFWLFMTSLVTLICSSNIFQDIRNLIWWPLIYFLFYTITLNDKSGKLISIFINRYVPCIFIIHVAIFILLRQVSMVATLSSGKEILVSDNSIFYILLLIPLVTLLSNKIKYLFLFVSIIATVYSFKRSAVVYVGLISLVTLYFDFYSKRKISIIHIVSSVLLLLLSVEVVTYVDSSFDGHLLSRFESISEDKGSGRLDIWANTLTDFSNKHFSNKVLGSGYNAVLCDGNEFSAHNDLIEMLYDFGYVGLFLYLIFIIKFVIIAIKVKQLNKKYYHASIISLIIFFVMSTVSHLWLYPSFFAYIMILLAFVNAKLKNAKNPL